MMTREEAIAYGLSFPDSYFDVPFHDPNWQLVRVKESKKAFLWTYERDGHIHLNVKAQPGWLEFWRQTYESVVPGYHQDKNHWNTIILDGTAREETKESQMRSANANLFSRHISAHRQHISTLCVLYS